VHERIAANPGEHVRLFISTDLEGVCGVVAEADVARAGSAAGAARAHLRADLLAVLEACRTAGAEEVVVCDGHDDGRNLEAPDLPDYVRLISGSPAPLSMLQGLRRGLDGALFVGYHARAGTEAAVLEHTWSPSVFRVAVGEVEVGEFGLGALLAGSFGVPALYLSGDDKATAEARQLVAGIVTTTVKRGISRTSAELISPDEARARMRRDVETALNSRVEVRPLDWSGAPVRVTFTRVAMCDVAAGYPGARRLDGRSLEVGGATFEEAYRGLLACMRLAALAG
jgi:D-amino peptidase